MTHGKTRLFLLANIVKIGYNVTMNGGVINVYKGFCFHQEQLQRNI